MGKWIKINNYILNPCMFFGNPELLQRNLHNDLNTLIKNVKARQDQYLTLLQYNKNLISNISQIQQMSFFADQINKHKSFLASSVSAHEKISAEEEQIKQKYSCAMSDENNVVKLMGRVIARVLEICQSSLEKAKFLDTSLSQKFNLLKCTLLQNMNESGKINIQYLLDTIIEYILLKDQKQIERLQQIIKILLQGNFQKLNQVYVPPPKPEIKKLAQKKQLNRSSSVQKSKQKQKLREKQQQRLSKYQQMRINNEKTKKKKAKAAKQLVNIYSIMDISKHQFLEDLNFTTNPEEKRKRLYQEIFSRNKFNYEQIMQFQAKKDQFQQKVKQFKQMMQLESMRIQQALVIIINKPLNQQPKAQQKNSVKQMAKKETKSDIGQDDQVETISPDKLQRVFRRREKKTLKAQSPRLNKQITFASMQSTQEGFQHIKFDLKNQQIFTRSNRARLPQIPGRSSLDNRYDGKSANRAGSQKKDEKPRINIMKNVQIGAINTSIAKNSLNETNNLKKSPRDRSGVESMFENITTSSTNGGLNGLQYTFYVRKKVNKFYQTKNNFIL